MDNLTCIWARKKEETTLTGWYNAGIYNTNTIILLQYNTIIYLKRKHTLSSMDESGHSQRAMYEEIYKKIEKAVIRKKITESILLKMSV